MYFELRHVGIGWHVIFRERPVRHAPGTLVEQGLLGKRHADSHDDAAAKLTFRMFPIDDPPAVERADPTGDAYLLRVLIDAHLAKMRAVSMHGIFDQLVRQDGFAGDLDLIATRAGKDSSISLALTGRVFQKQPSVAGLDIAESTSCQR